MRIMYKYLTVSFCVMLLSFSTVAKLSKDKSRLIKKSARSKAGLKAEVLKKKLHREAIRAVVQVEEASILLELNRPKAATKKLKLALKKIESAIASEKKDALLPVESDVNINELITTPAEIEADIIEAEKLLRQRDIQAVRELVLPMTSEITIVNAYLPLGIYPSHIKQAISELANNKISNAKDSLRMAESSIVEELIVLPIPILTAEESLVIAKSLHQNKESKEALKFISFSEDQLKIAKSLGYAPRHGKLYKRIFKEISKTRRAVRNGANTSLFSSMIKKIKKLFKHSQKTQKNNK